MSFLQRLILSNQQHNLRMNHISSVENDYASKPCEQLFHILANTQDQELIKGIKKLLLARGYTRKEIQFLVQPTPVNTLNN